MAIKFLIGLVLLSVASSALIGIECINVEKSEENAIDIITEPAKTHVEFPFYSQSLKTINPQLREYLVLDTEETLDLLGSVIGESLRSHTGFGLKSGYKLAGLISLGRKQEWRRRPYQRGIIAIRSEFNDEMLKMFDELIKTSDQRYKTIKTTPKNYEELDRDLAVYIDNLKQAIRSSPVAIYINFKEGMMGDVGFMEATSELMARLQHHGYGSVFWLVNKLLILVQSFTPKH